MKRLIVTSDDCGLSRGINLATVELYEKGLVTAASVMTNFPATQHALDLFSRYPTLEVGVHLNLTDGFPLTQVRVASSLTRADRRFRSPLALFVNALVARPSFREQAGNELTAQINVVFQAGLQPQHLTTHIHFHLSPALRKIIFRLAERFHVSWVRPYRLSATVVPFNPFLRKQSASNTSTGAESVAVPDYVAALKFWMSYSPDRLLAVLKTLPGTVELVVHPCIAGDDTFPQTVHYSSRERFQEMRYLERFWQLVAHIRTETG